MATNTGMLNRIFNTHSKVERLGSVLVFHLVGFFEMLINPIETLPSGQWLKKAALQGLYESMEDIKEFL